MKKCNPMISITASCPLSIPPSWALWERKLIDVMEQAIHPFLDRYATDDGGLIWSDEWSGSRDGADDFYESSYNWPLLYLLGGDEELLTLAQRQWDGITRQLTRLGPVHDEYERGYDQFHQAESYIYFYFLCLADPQNAVNRDRAQRFANLYLGQDPAVPNYDAVNKLIRAPHNGSGGPRWGYSDSDEPSYEWREAMRPYGLPYLDIPGIESYDDLKDPINARRMGEVMQERMGQGDVATNLLVTSLVANAYLLSGDPKYSAWIVEYVDAWIERAGQNGGLLPDNVGLSGQVGEYTQQKWYGGLYGWSWPHGFYNIGMAATVAGANAFLVTRDEGYLDLPRSQLALISEKGEMRQIDELEMSLRHHWLDNLTQVDESRTAFVVPYRYNDAGWFDHQPLSPIYPTAIWNLSMAPGDWQRIEWLQSQEGFDWRPILTFRNKEDNGHERPWLRYLAGDNPAYPEQILRSSYASVCRRMALIAEDEADLTRVNIHHWQEHNPVVTEALVQLTLGAPQIIYNGGLLICRVRYFDAERRRPGLPLDVAALVEKLEDKYTVIHLVNLSPLHARSLIIQAGGFGEHHFVSADIMQRTSVYPGSQKEYAAPEMQMERQSVPIDDRFLQVDLPPATEITLELTMERHVNQPSYAGPWTQAE